MLHNAVRTFSEDLSVISETIKQRTVQQIKTALQKKVGSWLEKVLKCFASFIQAYEEAGIQVQNVNNKIMQGQTGGSSAEVTLNALNASESEVDVESLAEFGNGGQVR